MGQCQVLPHFKYIPLLISVDAGPLFIYVVIQVAWHNKDLCLIFLCGENDKILRLGL